MGMVCVSQGQWYAGGMGGLSTLSADGRTVITRDSTAISLYKPENGAALSLFAGKHWREYLSVQGMYVWNRNALQFTETLVEGGRETTFEQKRTSSQNAGSVDGLLYFRPRASRFRPYVSGGLGEFRGGGRGGGEGCGGAAAGAVFGNTGVLADGGGDRPAGGEGLAFPL